MSDETNVCAICGCEWQEAIFDECPVCRLREKVDRLEAILKYHGLMTQ